MLKEDWRELFQPWILERGRNYWKSGNVTDLDWDGKCLSATVLGTEEYDVELFLDDGEVAEMYCSCPYAEDGNPCKHMAAVLFAAEAGTQETDALTKSVHQKYSHFPWRETLEKLSAEEMRDFLVQIVASDEDLQERLVLRYGQQNPVMLLDSWEEQIAEIVHRCSDRSGYINYVHADDFYHELNDFLNDRIPVLLASDRIMDAFFLVCLVYETAMVQGADDSDGGLTMLTDTCGQIWADILEASSGQQQEQIYQWFSGHLVVYSWCFGTDQVEDFLFSYEWTKPLLQKNLELLDDMIAKQPDVDYHLRGLLTWRESTMQRLNYPEEAVEAFWRQYRDLPFVRDRELERAMEKRNYDQAIKLLLEGKEKDREALWRVKGYSEKLIKLYQMTGQEALYREELRFQVFSCTQRDMAYVEQLCAITSPEEWPELSEKLLGLPTTKALRFELLAFDKQWQRLFDTIKQEGYLGGLDEYADLLIQWSPEQGLEGYTDMLKTAMLCASDRQMYRGIIGYLPRLQAYPNGAAAAQMLAALWRDQFPKRRAMLDELQKAGF